jgi:cytochrome c5
MNLSKIITICLVFLLSAMPGESLSADTEEAPCAAENSTSTDWQEQWYQLGKDTFNTVCKACHGAGKSTAPQIGDRDSWKNRSPLWSAVLLEHAKKGFMEMPPKGGAPGLSDRAVEAAGEYMLNVTFPELPPD